MSINRILLAGAAGVSGSDTRNYSLYESVDASNIFLRYGTIDVNTGTSSEEGFINIATPITGYTLRTDTCRHNGYLGYQSRYGFFIFNESTGSEVGSKKNSSYLIQNTGVTMCVVDDFIIGIEPYNTNNFRVWKFNTTDETFTTVYSGYSPSLKVFGVSNFNSGHFGLTYINSSNYDQIDKFNVSTNARTSLHTGSFTFTTSYPHSVRVAPLNDTDYIIAYKQNVTNYYLVAKDFATNTFKKSATITAQYGTSGKLNYGTQFDRGDSSSYLSFGWNTLPTVNMSSIVQRDTTLTNFRVFQGLIGYSGGFPYNSGIYPGATIGPSHLYNNIFINTFGAIFDASTLESIGTLNTNSSSPNGIFISKV